MPELLLILDHRRLKITDNVDHLQQESEWEGSLWGKNADFVSAEEFGAGQRKVSQADEPYSYYQYNDVRINRFALSLARVFGRGLPEVLKSETMDKIGASNEWKWQGYGAKPTAEINGPADGIGKRWGGGLWMNSRDQARFGLLILNGAPVKVSGSCRGSGLRRRPPRRPAVRTTVI